MKTIETELELLKQAINHDTLPAESKKKAMRILNLIAEESRVHTDQPLHNLLSNVSEQLISYDSLRDLLLFIFRYGIIGLDESFLDSIMNDAGQKPEFMQEPIPTECLAAHGGSVKEEVNQVIEFEGRYCTQKEIYVIQYHRTLQALDDIESKIDSDLMPPGKEILYHLRIIHQKGHEEGDNFNLNKLMKELIYELEEHDL